MAARLKKGDQVVVIAGSHKGKKGEILAIDRNKDRVTVEGVAMIKKHEKARSEGEQGGIVEKEGTVHISNVMRESTFEARKQKKQQAS